jgi:hypothetical protein
MASTSIAGQEKPYFEINREERHLCATLYSLLAQKNDNLKKFVSYLNSKLERDEDRIDVQQAADFDVYVEYSYLRDRWKTYSNKERMRLIDSLEISALLGKKPPELNADLVGFGKASTHAVQSPSTWSISTYSKLFPVDDQQRSADFKKLCEFKWCFKIKPDLVIQVNPKRVLSIEAKLVSPEGAYPAQAHRKDWKLRGLPTIRQTELQSFMFSHVLGIHASLFYLVKESRSDRRDGIPVITWREVFAQLDPSGAHPFVLRALKAKGWW